MFWINHMIWVEKTTVLLDVLFWFIDSLTFLSEGKNLYNKSEPKDSGLASADF